MTESLVTVKSTQAIKRRPKVLTVQRAIRQAYPATQVAADQRQSAGGHAESRVVEWRRHATAQCR